MGADLPVATGAARSPEEEARSIIEAAKEQVARMHAQARAEIAAEMARLEDQARTLAAREAAIRDKERAVRAMLTGASDG